MNTCHLKRGLAAALLGLSLWTLAGCRDFPRLTRLLGEPSPPLVLEISLDPAAPEEAEAVWSSGPAEEVETAVSGGEDRIIITVRIPCRALP